jgi:hypothetical protein
MAAELVSTLHGFNFGAAIVEATAEFPEHTVITIRTEAGRRLEVYCSKRGRSLRVFIPGKGELKHGPDPRAASSEARRA